jgi:hypothetical protein
LSSFHCADIRSAAAAGVMGGVAVAGAVEAAGVAGWPAAPVD